MSFHDTGPSLVPTRLGTTVLDYSVKILKSRKLWMSSERHNAIDELQIQRGLLPLTVTSSCQAPGSLQPFLLFLLLPTFSAAECLWSRNIMPFHTTWHYSFFLVLMKRFPWVKNPSLQLCPHHLSLSPDATPQPGETGGDASQQSPSSGIIFSLNIFDFL